MTTPLILSIDQGTTSSRALLLDQAGQIKAVHQSEFTQYFPHDGWVEHDVDEIWQTTLQVTQKALRDATQTGAEVVAIGITNQRETTIVWDRQTGEPIHRAIVWQDRRTAAICDEKRKQGVGETVTMKTGLLLDSYFSATKIAWVLDNVEGARARADRGELAFGTVDSYLIWKLTGGKHHLTDATNASRTMLFDIVKQRWDEELLTIFDVPENMLPEVRDCAADFGLTNAELTGRAIPICGVAGDQQAALVGQACFSPGMVKSTYGTGCFMVMNTGSDILRSEHQLLSTVGYRLAGEVTYALEGSIFVAGAAIQWLRDGLSLLQDAAASEQMATEVDDAHGLVVVPALTGLGAPHWQPDARGAILGLTRDSGKPQIVRASLESIAFQSADVLQAMIADGGQMARLRVDGGMANNNWFCQFLSDVLNVPVDRPVNTETTALGAAYLAGLQVGLYPTVSDIQSQWQQDRSFEVGLSGGRREALLKRWRQAVELVKQFPAVD